MATHPDLAGHRLPQVNIEADEAALIGRMLREYSGTLPGGQLIEEIGSALAVRRRHDSQ